MVKTIILQKKFYQRKNNRTTIEVDMENAKDQITLVEIRERLVRIETILEEQDFRAVERSADDALALAKKNEKAIIELQSYVKWFVMAVLGAVVAAVCALVLK